MLTRTGYITKESPDIKKELTVRALENAVGLRPPAFKVFRCDPKGNMCVPRYYGTERFGKATDRRPDPVRANIRFNGKLRDETRQNEALDLFNGTESGGVLSLPCGYGKTTVALAIAGRLGVRTMIVVHKEFLANQWRERIQQFCPGATVGIVQGDRFELECDFVIAMIQTMCQREHPVGAFESIGLLIVDEAHHIGAPAFSQFMFKLCPKYTLGLTATPERKDGLTRILYWFLGPSFLTIERQNQQHVQVNKLMFDCEEFNSGPPVNRLGKVSLVDIVNLLVGLDKRNKLILDTVETCRAQDRRILILTDRRGHCFELAEAIKGSGLYIGGMKEKDLDESSRCQVIIATFSQAHEGLDIPCLDTVILATPHSDVKQAVGRILRETHGKQNNPVIYDIVDYWSVLFAMWQKRLAMYRQSGFLCEGGAPEPEAPQACMFI